MALTITSSTYAGENAGEWIKAAIQTLSSFDHITIKDNIQEKRVVQKLTTTATFVDDACSFSASGSVTTNERVLEPKRIMLNDTICPDGFYADWAGVERGVSVHDGAELPPTFEEFLIADYLDRLASHVETKIWQGASGTPGEWEGFSALFAADGDVNDVSTPVTLTESVIVDEMERLLDVMPSAVLDASEKPKIYVNGNTARLYRRKMSSLGYLDQYYAAEVPMNFEGYELAICNGIADDKMYCAQPSNLWFGTGLLSDHNEIKLLPQADVTGAKDVNIVIRFSGGCQHGIGGDIGAYNA